MKRLAPLGLLALSLTGCRLKGPESFLASTTPHPVEMHQSWYGDQWSYGGIGVASGGRDARAQYGRGARRGGSVNPSYDQPAKGTGLQPGEVPAENKPWWATQNAPAWQPGAGEVSGNGTRVKQ